MQRRTVSWKSIVVVQGVVLAAFGVAWSVAAQRDVAAIQELLLHRPIAPQIELPRPEPLVIAPLYDRPDLVSDDDLRAVLRQILPRFDRQRLRPNHVEHALRTWGLRATFADPELLSGTELAEFLTDHGKYVDSWGSSIRPLLEERALGVSVRWGPQEVGGSVHHDHWLACLSEAGAPLQMPIYTPGRGRHTLRDVLMQSLRDFRLDERETEWSALAFGLWIPPARTWIGAEGREYSFDLLARRLMRGKKELGVCSGTHRVYSLVVLLRLDDEFQLLSESVRGDVWAYLVQVRDAIARSQFADGHWPSNWPEGAEAISQPIDDPLYKQVIATGHHLEWLAIAPQELHPDEQHIARAMKWIIEVTKQQTPQEIRSRYTFFSHVGSALALWRKTHPAEFWSRIEGSDGPAIDRK